MTEDREQARAELRASIIETRKDVQRARRVRRRDKAARARRRPGPDRPSLRRIRIGTRVLKARERRLARRRAQLEQLDRQGVAAAIEWAIGLAGKVREQGTNRGPFINGWIRAGGGELGWPWCAYFVEAFMRAAGLQQFMGGLADQFRIWGRNGTNGFRLVAIASRQPGDLVMFDWNGNGSADHIGVYIGGGRTVEGNTSAGAGGSQNDGDGVWIRQRGTANICAVARPPYPA